MQGSSACCDCDRPHKMCSLRADLRVKISTDRKSSAPNARLRVGARHDGLPDCIEEKRGDCHITRLEGDDLAPGTLNSILEQSGLRKGSNHAIRNRYRRCRIELLRLRARLAGVRKYRCDDRGNRAINPRGDRAPSRGVATGWLADPLANQPRRIRRGRRLTSRWSERERDKLPAYNAQQRGAQRGLESTRCIPPAF